MLHQAALGSVPRSLADPIATNETNITGFLNMLCAVRDAAVGRFVYAASSSNYGDHPALPKVEDAIGRPLSPYAVTKYVNELYADVFGRSYGFQSIGLRYFNVFGSRQEGLQRRGGRPHHAQRPVRRLARRAVPVRRARRRAAREARFPRGRRAAFAPDVSKAARLLGYVPSHALGAGIGVALPWYVGNAQGGGARIAKDGS